VLGGYDRISGGGDMRTLTIVMIPALVLAGVSTAAALDCARVKALRRTSSTI